MKTQNGQKLYKTYRKLFGKGEKQLHIGGTAIFGKYSNGIPSQGINIPFTFDGAGRCSSS